MTSFLRAMYDMKSYGLLRTKFHHPLIQDVFQSAEGFKFPTSAIVVAGDDKEYRVGVVPSVMMCGFYPTLYIIHQWYMMMRHRGDVRYVGDGVLAISGDEAPSLLADIYDWVVECSHEPPASYKFAAYLGWDTLLRRLPIIPTISEHHRGQPTLGFHTPFGAVMINDDMDIPSAISNIEYVQFPEAKDYLTDEEMHHLAGGKTSYVDSEDVVTVNIDDGEGIRPHINSVYRALLVVLNVRSALSEYVEPLHVESASRTTIWDAVATVEMKNIFPHQRGFTALDNRKDNLRIYKNIGCSPTGRGVVSKPELTVRRSTLQDVHPARLKHEVIMRDPWLLIDDEERHFYPHDNMVTGWKWVSSGYSVDWRHIIKQGLYRR